MTGSLRTQSNQFRIICWRTDQAGSCPISSIYLLAAGIVKVKLHQYLSDNLTQVVVPLSEISDIEQVTALFDPDVSVARS